MQAVHPCMGRKILRKAAWRGGTFFFAEKQLMEPLPKSGLAWTAKLISPLAVLSSCPVRQTSDFAPLHGGITSEIPVHAPYLAAERCQFFYVMMGANFRGANSNPPTLRQFLNVSRVRNSNCQLERKPERKKVLVPSQMCQTDKTRRRADDAWPSI